MQTGLQYNRIMIKCLSAMHHTMHNFAMLKEPCRNKKLKKCILSTPIEIAILRTEEGAIAKIVSIFFQSIFTFSNIIISVCDGLEIIICNRIIGTSDLRLIASQSCFKLYDKF